MKTSVDGRRLFVLCLGAWLLVTTSLVALATWHSRTAHAVIEMGMGLILLWVVLGGTLMYRFREAITNGVRRIPWDWRVKFVLFCILLAMIEEAITTTMTNLAPLFGVRIGEAYITASTNYWDVICFHSVVVFVAFFVGWAWLLSRYDFSPFSVFVLFGLTGTVAESLYGGPQHLLEFGMWIFVYGLMVYLPARSIPARPKAKTPRWWHYPLAVFAPFPFMLLVPLVPLVHILAPHHPNVHFPPIRS